MINDIDYLVKKDNFCEYKMLKSTNPLIKINSNKYYLLFNCRNNLNVYDQYAYYQKIVIDYSPFIEELNGYDESLEYYEQTGECKAKIDYYLNLINDK